MPVKIKESGWRWHIAQWVLRVLYQRPTHYISPWKGAGLGAGVVLHHDGKILLGKRSGNIEGSGTYGIIGGFMNIEDHETFAENLVREVYEEAHLRLDPHHFSNDAIRLIRLMHGREFIEMSNYSACVMYFQHELNAEQVKDITPMDETDEFIWADEATFKKMVADKQICFAEVIDVIEDFFTSRT